MSWRSCRIGSCQRHCSCMYAPCRSAIPSPGSEKAQPMPTTLKAETLRALAEKATPGKLSTAERHTEHEHIECPVCQGDGEVLATDYCNIDEKALGVQFYGIGSEFGAHEALWSYLVNAVPEILALLEADKDERVAALEDENARTREALEPFALAALQWRADCSKGQPYVAPGSAWDAAAVALGKDQA